MSSDADFDDLIERLGGFGKYQKRVLYLILGPLFFIMPFPLLHQVAFHRYRDSSMAGKSTINAPMSSNNII